MRVVCPMARLVEGPTLAETSTSRPGGGTDKSPDVSGIFHLQVREADGGLDISVGLRLRVRDLCNIWGSADIGGFLVQVAPGPSG